MPDRIVSSAKDIGIASGGLLLSYIPDWFTVTNEILLGADGFYKAGIFLITAYAIWYRHVKKDK